MNHRLACMERGCEICRAVIEKHEYENSRGVGTPAGPRNHPRLGPMAEILRACAVSFTPRIQWPERMGDRSISLLAKMAEIEIRSTICGYSWSLKSHPVGFTTVVGATLTSADARFETTDAIRQQLPLLLGRAIGRHRFFLPDTSDRLTRDSMQRRLGTASFLLLKAGPAAQWLGEQVAELECERLRRCQT